MTSRVLIEAQPGSNRRFVMIGTGRALDSTDIASTQAQAFYSILDGNGTRFNATANLPSGVSFPIQRANLVQNSNPLTGATLAAASMGWYLELGAGSASIGWRVISDPTSYFGTVAFASTLPNGSACSPSGSSRVHAVDFGTGKTTLTSTTPAANGLPASTSLIAYNASVTGVIRRPAVLQRGRRAQAGGRQRRRRPEKHRRRFRQRPGVAQAQLARVAPGGLTSRGPARWLRSGGQTRAERR